MLLRCSTSRSTLLNGYGMSAPPGYVVRLFRAYPRPARRYTLFYILYPLGAGSEAYLMYISIPWAKYKYGKPGMFALMSLVMLWPPGKQRLATAASSGNRELTMPANIPLQLCLPSCRICTDRELSISEVKPRSYKSALRVGD